MQTLRTKAVAIGWDLQWINEVVISGRPEWQHALVLVSPAMSVVFVIDEDGDMTSAIEAASDYLADDVPPST